MSSMPLTFDAVQNHRAIKAYIERSKEYLDNLGYTDHGYRHVELVAKRARLLAQQIGLNEHDQELAAIAGYCHDMGNFLGRTDHHYWGSLLFAQSFVGDDYDLADTTAVMQAIANHDKIDLKIVSQIGAALVIADKSDVHRSRVSKEVADLTNDIHDRVNYAATNNELTVNKRKKEIYLTIKIDTKIVDPIEYFEIFIDRMTFCRQAADYLGYNFVLTINNFKLS